MKVNYGTTKLMV